MKQKPIQKDCSLCYGSGYNSSYKSYQEWNYALRRIDLKYRWERSRCYRCSATGKVVDQKAQRLQKKRIAEEQRKKQEEKQKQFQQFKVKEQKFHQYLKQNEIHQPLLQQQYEDSSQNEQSLRWSQIQIGSISQNQRSKGIMYCGICTGTGYERKYLSNQVSICSNCNGLGKVNLNEYLVNNSPNNNQRQWQQPKVKKVKQKNKNNHYQRQQPPKINNNKYLKQPLLPNNDRQFKIVTRKQKTQQQLRKQFEQIYNKEKQKEKQQQLAKQYKEKRQQQQRFRRYNERIKRQREQQKLLKELYYQTQQGREQLRRKRQRERWQQRKDCCKKILKGMFCCCGDIQFWKIVLWILLFCLTGIFILFIVVAPSISYS